MRTQDEHPLEDPREITFSQLINGFFRIKISALLSMTGIFLAYSAALFQLGAYLQHQTTAIAFDRPFDMNLDFSQDSLEELRSNSSLQLDKIYLIKGEPIPTLDEDHFLLRVRRIDDNFNTVSLGHIIAQKGKIRDLPTVPRFVAQSAVNAQPNFEWHGHETNYQFYEEFISSNTIRRYYDDGWILEYQIDRQGRSIMSTFRWINKG